MNYRLVARLTGVLLLLLAAAMALPVAVSLYCRDGAQFGLLLSMAVMAVVGLLLRNVAGRHATFELHERESYWITAAVWTVVPAIGSLPYLLTGSIGNLTDAVFESVSGFSTTGSSVVVDPATLPSGLLVWRSMTQWVGGLGLILFVVALQRRLRGSTLALYGAEFSGTQQRRLHPKIATSVSRLWGIYLVTTIVLIVLLALAGNGMIDSFCLALSTVSTGGFMTAATGLDGYSKLTMALITLFMFLSGVGVALLYNFFTFHWCRLRRSDEFIVYAAVYLIAVVACAASFGLRGNGWGESLGYSLFHVASTVSTCGFYTTGPMQWPFAASVVTFMLILSGAMAGSTGGGIKLRRLMTLSLYLRNYFTRMLHPNVVFTIRIDRQVVPSDYVNKIFGFVFLYILFIIFDAFALTLGGSGIADAFCLAAANISNLGPSPLINTMGANLEYAMLPVGSKWTLMVLMLAGRLEIFALLAIVSPAYWRRR